MAPLLPPTLLLVLRLLVLLLFSNAGGAGAIPLGSVLTPSNSSSSSSSSSWSSPNGTFSVRFVPSPSHPSLFLASIVFSGGLPVWSAGGASAAVDSSASLSLLPDGDLRLLNGSGALVWSSNTSSLSVSSAALLDSGNLVLQNASDSPLWQSFENPTDTLVQSQNFTSAASLVSGPYSFSLLRSSGNLTLRWNGTVVYFNEGYNASFTANRTLSSPTLFLQSNGILSLADAALGSSPVVVAYSSNYGESGITLRFVRLDPDGNLRVYSVSGGSSAPTEQWSAVADQCEVFAYCGNMGVCSYNDTGPVCGCPSQNFLAADPADPRQGCRPRTPLDDCRANWTMLELENTRFLTYPPDVATEQFFIGITACRQNCLSGQSCLASTALADGSGFCYIVVDFVSGYHSAALPSTSYVKVCAPEEPNPPPGALAGAQPGTSKLRAWIVVVAVLCTLLALVFCESALWWFFCRNSPKYGPASAQYALLEYASGAPVQFSYRELDRSTKGFKERLGAGGFGSVYRGTLANRTVVAVKQLEGIEQGEKQFRMEVATISSTHHLNLVRLIGFCSEGRHRLLVYEFMKNGSLDRFIFSEQQSSSSSSSSSSENLPWKTRFSIAVGTARGITYLHEECRDCIIHCDIKPENILLDDNFSAKVSDFGLAKLLHPKDHRHRTLTSVRGTRGYLAPEWLANLPITSKSDVYSYGMVLLEIVSGRRNFDMSEETGRKKFSVFAYEEFEKGNLRSVLDKKIYDEEIDMGQVERAVMTSFWCIQEQPSLRPSMSRVVQMLEGVMEIEVPPAPKVTDSLSPIPYSSSSVQAAEGSLSISMKRSAEKPSLSLISSEQSLA
ncbi:G-type lectin S-receptor-like serine/threonine-protein kinase [Ananas comosus]|uniref:Receptor-like serine/threonine-protein kinase n=1 Tax=Ananas comosus TaxID=4615 RepID=A0A199VI18_ANACO|nr:G-type lectin S-receptor-like serine/threonine-protein kinase [Ananas comosus]